MVFSVNKDAVDAAFEAYLEDPHTQPYCIGSAVGPQHSHLKTIGRVKYETASDIEARNKQFSDTTGMWPDD